jgi:hypothetical protein
LTKRDRIFTWRSFRLNSLDGWLMNAEELLDKPAARLVRKSSDTLNAIVRLGGLAVAVAGLLYLGLSRLQLSRDANIVALIAVVVLAATVAGGYLYIRFVHRPPDYRIDNLNGTLVARRVGDYHHYVYTREQNVTATRDGVQLIRMRDGWTGDGSLRTRLRSIHPEHVLLDVVSPELRRTYCWFYLGEGGVRRGVKVNVGLEREFEDDIEHMKPYYRESGEDAGIGELVLTLRFDRDDEPVKVEEIDWFGTGPARRIHHTAPAQQRRVEADYIEYTRTVRRVRPGHAHGFTWKWADAKGG